MSGRKRSWEGGGGGGGGGGRDDRGPRGPPRSHGVCVCGTVRGVSMELLGVCAVRLLCAFGDVFLCMSVCLDVIMPALVHVRVI